MNYRNILVSVADGVADVVLNRPDVRNAIDQAMIDDLHRALDALEPDPSVNAVIFSGASTPIAGSYRFNAPIAAKGRIYAAGDGGVVAFTP